MTVLAARGLSQKFGVTSALSNITLDISAGEKVALIGASGGGKTTFLRLLGLQDLPTSGEVSAFDSVLTQSSFKGLREVRSRIGMLPQDLGLVPNLRVVQNVILARSGKRNVFGTMRDLLWPTKAEREKIFDILNRMGVAEKMYDRTESLSGGQQQRVALARTLYQGAEILLADEPLSAVDPARARDVLVLLTEMASAQKMTLVVSLHQVALAREFFPRIIGLKEGRVVFDGEPTDEKISNLYGL